MTQSEGFETTHEDAVGNDKSHEHRELLGSGTLFGYPVIPQQLYDWGYQNNGLMILPPMALITVACIIWVHRSRNKDLQQ